MSAHQGSGSLLIIICFNLMSGEVKSQPDVNSSDPCYNYTVLDDVWRATNYSSSLSKKCDQSITWVGWYRMMYGGQDVQMPESCVSISMCSTDAPLWINGTHPQLEDGVVTRQVCGNWVDDCCHFKSYPIQVKACEENYYVYEFVKPSGCWLTYCADIATIKPREDVHIQITHLAGLKMKLSSTRNLLLPDTHEILLQQVKDELVRKGLPENITLHLKSISKVKEVQLDTQKNETCRIT